MKCPVCAGVDLVMSDRQGIEIDYCPKCRGVWLDRGELDKIIERSAREDDQPPAMGRAQTMVPPQHQPQQTPGYQQPMPMRRDDSDDSKFGYTYQQPQQGQPYRKKSIWRELLDF